MTDQKWRLGAKELRGSLLSSQWDKEESELVSRTEFLIPGHIIFAVAPETKETWNRNTNHNLAETINNRWQDICAGCHPLHQRGTPEMDADTPACRRRHGPFQITFQTPFMGHQPHI